MSIFRLRLFCSKYVNNSCVLINSLEAQNRNSVRVLQVRKCRTLVTSDKLNSRTLFTSSCLHKELKETTENVVKPKLSKFEENQKKSRLSRYSTYLLSSLN